ncbi:MAG: hypothetical protein MPJ78_13880 [Hyphomicrobiaceae bacterium]|nr:hypothetical protein [Hyphomicrobiaceae bacterium]
MIHRWFSQITPKYQGRQLYRQITRVIAQHAIDRFSKKQIYYCGRTRTPVGWQAQEKYTKRLAPDLIHGKYHPDLIRIAIGLFCRDPHFLRGAKQLSRRRSAAYLLVDILRVPKRVAAPPDNGMERASGSSG